MKVLLVDGSALVYRAYFAFARNPLMTSRGEPTSVAFGFLGTLLRWLRHYRPEAVAIAFDPPGRTHRHELFPEYKANRPARPEGLAEQLPRLAQALAALRVSIVELPGWEADDVLATLARQCEDRGDSVYLASGDKDFRQLVSERVRLLRPQAGAGADDEIGVAELARETGLAPAQIVDAMALSGDSVDNVPGIAGIGEKTAAGLIREHGSLATLYARLDTIPRPALRDKLAAGRERAWISRELVRLRFDAPVESARALPEWPGPDWSVLRALLKELELFALLRQLPAERQPAEAIECEWVRTPEDLAALAATLARAPVIALHLETRGDGGTPGDEIAGLAFATGPGAACAVRVAAAPPPARPGELAFGAPPAAGLPLGAVRDALAPLLADPRCLKVGQDLKRIARVLDRHAMPLAGPFFDTGVAAYVASPERHRYDLEALALEYLDVQPTAAAAADSDSARQAARDGVCATIVWRLRDVLQRQLDADGLTALFADVEMPLAQVLGAMEREGVQLDVAALQRLSDELGQRAEECAERVFTFAGRRFNLQSPAQLGAVLFGELGLPHGRRNRNGWSTDVDVLERLAPEHPIGAALLEYRQLVKLRSTYTEALPRLVDARTGRIHTSFNQTVASTGRLSSSDPNLQNIPIRSELGRRIRAAFVPRDLHHRLISADYSQIELRLMAHLSGDEALCAAFAAGGDVHTLTAARIAGCAPEAVTPAQRSAAKTVNFGVIYGMGARGLAERLGIGVDAAKRFIDEYFASYPGVRRCTQELVRTARESGFATTLLGRRLRLPDLASDSPARRAAAERVAINAPIQGSAADLIKLAMVRVHTRLLAAGHAARLVLQVHDELVLDVPETEVEPVAALVRHEMQAALPLRVPVVVDIGTGANWAEAH